MEIVIGQVDGSTVIDAAARHSWEAAAVALVLLVLLGTIGWLMRMLWQINQRLADRVTNLEAQLTDRLVTIVANTTEAVVANTQMLERTATAIDKLEVAVEHSLRTQETIMARIETSPCLMVATFSDETKMRLTAARDAAEAAKHDKKRE